MDLSSDLGDHTECSLTNGANGESREHIRQHSSEKKTSKDLRFGQCDISSILILIELSVVKEASEK